MTHNESICPDLSGPAGTRLQMQVVRLPQVSAFLYFISSSSFASSAGSTVQGLALPGSPDCCACQRWAFSIYHYFLLRTVSPKWFYFHVGCPKPSSGTLLHSTANPPGHCSFHDGRTSSCSRTAHSVILLFSPYGISLFWDSVLATKRTGEDLQKEHH